MTALAAPGGTRLAHTVSDSGTMFRRNLLHIIRYPELTMFVIGGPVLFLLLFVYVFGGTLGAGLPGGGRGGAIQDYLAYVVPGILLAGVAGTAQGAAIGIAMDMTEGIVARFRSMAISRAAVLTGHVLGNTVQALLCSAVVVGIALALGLRPSASPLGWLGAAAVLALSALALSWLAVAMGMAARSVESASNLPMILVLLPFLGSGFVPTASMPAWMQGFAEYQPFTAYIETVRALLSGGTPGEHGWLALGWSIVIGVAGFVWALMLYARKSVR